MRPPSTRTGWASRSSEPWPTMSRSGRATPAPAPASASRDRCADCRFPIGVEVEHAVQTGVLEDPARCGTGLHDPELTVTLVQAPQRADDGAEPRRVEERDCREIDDEGACTELLDQVAEVLTKGGRA